MVTLKKLRFCKICAMLNQKNLGQKNSSGQKILSQKIFDLKWNTRVEPQKMVQENIELKYLFQTIFSQKIFCQKNLGEKNIAKRNMSSAVCALSM